jgi:hypothetical protein
MPTYILGRNEFVESDYVLVFLAAPAAYRPPWMWLLKAYRALDRRYGKSSQESRGIAANSDAKVL